MKKVIKIIMFSILIMILLTNFIYADNDLTSNMGRETWDYGNDKLVEPFFATVIGVVQAVSMVTMTIVVVYTAIKYMISSPNDKATVIAQMKPILIGAIIILGVEQLVKWAAGFAYSVF